MDFALGLIAVLALWKIRFIKHGENDCLNHEQTSAVNGVFVLLVFLRHFEQYISFGKYDNLFRNVDGKLEQLIVTTFLFYSGYGMAYSLMNKKNYLRKIPQRFFRVLIQFDVAVALYLILNIILGEKPSVQHVLLSFIGWDSLGNSNWYIFAILCMYIIFYISGLITERNGFKFLPLFVGLGCVAYAAVLYIVGRPSYTYNTIFCFLLGVVFGTFPKTVSVVFKKKWTILICEMIASFLLFAVLFKAYHAVPNELIKVAAYELESVFFVLVVLLMTRFIKIGNPALDWLGKHVFEVYILQRLPMIIFEDVFSNKYIYFILCLLITILLAFLFKQAEKGVDKIVRNRRKVLPDV